MNTTDHSYICHEFNPIDIRGIPYGETPFGSSLTTFMLQFSMISSITRLLHFLLKPIRQPLIVAQILGGIVLGPSLLGRDLMLFPRKSRLVLDTLSLFGFMLFVFLIGVKTDISIVVRSDKKALAVGICSFFIPLVLAGSVSYILCSVLSLDDDTSRAIPHIVQMLSMTAFPVVTCFLEELNILNSDIGRLASTSSVICDVCVCSTKIIQFLFSIAKTNSLMVVLGSFATAGSYLLIVVFVIRPMALWVIQHTPEISPVREIHLLLWLVMILAAGLIGEVIGIHGTIACLVLGLIVPDGPPLGASLVETLESFVTIILLPLFFSVSGLKVDIFHIQNLKNVGVLQLVIMVSFVGKLMGSLLPLMAYRIPFQDAFSLGLIMNTKGIVELAFLNYSLNQNVVTEEIYSLMIISMVTITGVITPVVKLIYDPSKRYVAYKRRTILHCTNNDELRILVSIHQQQDVHSIISLLHVSHPTQDSPINLVVLHLVKLMGRSSSLLMAHRTPDEEKLPRTQTERILNAFKKLERKPPGLFMVHCYKGISPYSTMHNDVCSLALEKRVILIILPFNKKLGCDETIESNHTFRRINRCVLEQAPCSVGILIDHPYLRASHLVTETSEFQLVMLFFGGPDDREALAYARRMSSKNSARLTIIKISSSGQAEMVAGSERSKQLDTEILSNIKKRSQQDENIEYKEQAVSSAMDVIAIARSAVNEYNLVMAGRRHQHGDSKIMEQLAKWNDHGELGAIGEILAASEGEGSILVMQQQTKLWGLKDPEESTHLRRIKL